MTGSRYFNDLDSRNTSGRCRPCGLLYNWLARLGRRLRDAHCARCGRLLSQTTTANLKKATARLATEAPDFQRKVGR